MSGPPPSPLRPSPAAIVIVRHGKPSLARDVRLTWREYEDWWRAYDESGLAEGQAPPPALVEEVRGASALFSSTLRRAIETAAATVEGRGVIADPVFVEAPLPPPPLPGRARPVVWGGIARVSWWLGAARGAETRRDAELRAEAAVATLTARALRGEMVACFAHGWFNRMMRPVLRRQGWVCVRDGGDGHWGSRRYERRG